MPLEFLVPGLIGPFQFGFIIAACGYKRMLTNALRASKKQQRYLCYRNQVVACVTHNCTSRSTLPGSTSNVLSFESRPSYRWPLHVRSFTLSPGGLPRNSIFTMHVSLGGREQFLWHIACQAGKNKTRKQNNKTDAQIRMPMGQHDTLPHQGFKYLMAKSSGSKRCANHVATVRIAIYKQCVRQIPWGNHTRWVDWWLNHARKLVIICCSPRSNLVDDFQVITLFSLSCCCC